MNKGSGINPKLTGLCDGGPQVTSPRSGASDSVTLPCVLLRLHATPLSFSSKLSPAVLLLARVPSSAYLSPPASITESETARTDRTVMIDGPQGAGPGRGRAAARPTKLLRCLPPGWAGPGQRPRPLPLGAWAPAPSSFATVRDGVEGAPALPPYRIIAGLNRVRVREHIWDF